MAITLSILNGFSKLFHCWKAKEISNKTNIILPTILSVSCRTNFWKLEVWNCGNFQNNNLKTQKLLLSYGRILSQKLLEVCAFCLLPTHMREDIHATRRLHCHWWSGQCHAKHAENAASVHNTCLDKIVCYLQRIFNRNRKLKQQVRK